MKVNSKDLPEPVFDPLKWIDHQDILTKLQKRSTIEGFMETILPSSFNPAELARSKQSGKLALPVTHFKRFSAMLANTSGEVVAQAKFELNETRHATAAGTLQTSVNVVCQRCMQEMKMDLSASFSFIFVASEEEANDVEDDYDPVLVDNRNEITSVNFLEDELILQLPLRIVHDSEEQCDPSVIQAVTTAEQTGPAKTHNPFSGLDKLLKN